MEEEEAHGEQGFPESAVQGEWEEKGKKKKGCSLSIVLDSMEQSEPPAEDAINRLKAGWPGGRTARQPLLHFHIRRLFLLKQKV